MIGRTKIAILLLALPVCALAREEYTRTFDKTVTLQPGQKFRLEHSLGDIEIHTHPSRDVIIHTDIKASASNANDAKSFADKIAVLVENSAGMLAVRTKYPERPSSFLAPTTSPTRSAIRSRRPKRRLSKSKILSAQSRQPGSRPAPTSEPPTARSRFETGAARSAC